MRSRMCHIHCSHWLTRRSYTSQEPECVSFGLAWCNEYSITGDVTLCNTMTTTHAPDHQWSQCCVPAGDWVFQRHCMSFLSFPFLSFPFLSFPFLSFSFLFFPVLFFSFLSDRLFQNHCSVSARHSLPAYTPCTLSHNPFAPLHNQVLAGRECSGCFCSQHAGPIAMQKVA